jgi:hypothetical protein
MSNLAACECRASLLFLSLILPNSTFADLRVQQASRPDYRAPSPTLAALPIALTLITLTLIVEGC